MISEASEIPDAKALIVRHAYSIGNAGERSETPAGIDLHEIGHQQAQLFADFLTESPKIIVHSPYIRTKLTAQPSINKFPDAEVIELPIHEFTYLDPAKYSGTTHEERKSAREHYWLRLDPEYRDGGEAESFVDVWNRVEALKAFIGSKSKSLIFTHGLMMKLLILQMYGHSSPNEKAMTDFYELQRTLAVPNTAWMVARSSTEFSRIKTDHLSVEMVTY